MLLSSNLLEMIVIISLWEKNLTLPCERLYISLASRRQDRSAQLLVRDGPCHGQRAGHAREEHSGLPAALFFGRSSHESGDPRRHFLDDSIHRRSHHARL